MIVVTHEIGFAREVSNKVIFLHQGLIESEGPPQEMFGNPESERFRQFFHGMLARGVNLAPSAYEAGFVSAMHGAVEIEQTIEAAAATFAEL